MTGAAVVACGCRRTADAPINREPGLPLLVRWISQLEFGAIDFASAGDPTARPVIAVLELIGFTAIVTQVFLMRELLVVFQSHEI